MPFVMLLLLVALPSAARALQPEVRGDVSALQFDLFLAAGVGGLQGGQGRRVFGGPGAIGAGIERRIAASGSWRAEALIIGTFGELVPDGTAERPTVTANHSGVSLGYRRYSGRNRFLGAGLGVAAVTLCEVEPEVSIFDPNAGVKSCDRFEDVLLRAGRVVSFVTASGGVVAGPVSVGLRLDAGLQPTLRTEHGAMYLANIGILGEYRFGRGRRRASASSDGQALGIGDRR